MINEIDEALNECGFTLNDGVSEFTGSVNIRIEGTAFGVFVMITKFNNDKEIYTRFDWDDIENTFPWKGFTEAPK